MEGLFTLLSLSIVMAIASFLAGALPLSFSLSPSQLRLISTIGMGVLVGTSLIVIIPEGVETLYSASSGGHGHKRRDIAQATLDVRWPNAHHAWIQKRGTAEVDDFKAMPGPVIPAASPMAPAPPSTPTAAGEIHILGSESSNHQGKDTKEHHDEDHHEEKSPHAWIGLALISGFVLMFLIDKLPQHASTSSKQSQQPYHISLDNLGRGLHLASSPGRDSESEAFVESERNPRQSRSFATTTGLVIHAAADGIALGASTSSSNTSLSFIIFLAIMIHKAPAAFGLTSVLLKQGLSKRAARGHLLLFSLAAPAGALATWAVAHALGGGGSVGSEEGTKWWTGMLLLFSGGTFLYVAMHTMQEEDSPGHESRTNGHANGREAQQQQKPPIRDLMAAVCGMILPLFLQISHAH